jgi:DNA-binding NtrC family response regulator
LKKVFQPPASAGARCWQSIRNPSATDQGTMLCIVLVTAADDLKLDSLTPQAQVKLLRLLQEKEYRPLRSTRVKQANVRVIAAANADVQASLGAGRLRADLFYRHNVLPVRILPLRDRREDLIPLVTISCARMPRTITARFQRSALRQWPR